MTGAKKRLRPKAVADPAKVRELDTIRLLNEALEQQDLQQLRKLAAVRGLVNSELRKACWPRLLGLQDEELELPRPYTQLAAAKHRDTGVVKVDVQRAPFGLHAEGREVTRAELERLLNAVVNLHPGSVHYYQGLHDVGAVLLLVAGERVGFHLLRRLALCQLRDCTRPTLEPVMELMQLLYVVLAHLDPQLHEALAAKQLEPYFGLRWLITWFAHDLDQLADASRLFDLFMASHPLMPLYAGALVMSSQRQALLDPELEMPELHALLVRARPFDCLTADQLAQQAVQLFRRCPPEQLLARPGLQLRTSVAAAAHLQGECWVVPQRPGRPGHIRRGAGTFLVLGRELWQRRRSKAALLTTAVSVTSVLSVWAVVALMSAVMQRQGMHTGLPL